ncbi:MAG: phage tail protein [Desulfobacterium sp.]|nr:phage tail protein [Desulfobacterium sp.]MBU3948445.1 phage tail protein [Pseudomonadota bacterium]MBU4035798.1 phage tail protein [Pseudomonadota bacterium]
MGMFNVNTHRFDPYKNFKFRVKWDGKYIPGITKISPLTRITETVIYREGGDASNYRLSPGTTKFEPIVIERGLSHDTSFEDWANMVFSLDGDSGTSLLHYKKDIVIDLFNLQGVKVMAFIVYRCWVSEYQSLPELDSNGKCIAIEKIVLQHEGWVRDTSVLEPQET